MNSQLIIDVNNRSGESRIALLEDAQLVEYRSVTKQDTISVGDIYLGVVRRVMPNHNAAFVDIGQQKEGFLHIKDLGPHYSTMVQGVRRALQGGKRTRGGGGRKEAASAEPTTTETQSQLTSTAPSEQPLPEKNGKIADFVKSGQVILVQVVREPFSNKGPSLTTEISLAGRNLVLLPYSTRVMMSSKISTREEVTRLRRILASILPQGFGVIVRTAAEGKGVEALNNELQSLLARWEHCLAQLSEHPKPPLLLLGEIKSASAILRDNLNGSYSSIQVNDKALYQELRTYLTAVAPQEAEIVKLYNSPRVPIFDNFDVTKQLKRLLGQTVFFHKGSYLIIQHPEAFHVIDVNSGSGAKHAGSPEETALEVNLAACDEIARQLRLRDMGGIIVIDFIDMAQSANRKQVYEKMRQLMAKDRVTHRILEITDFGLMQITRQRHRPEQRIDTSEACPCCAGSGRVESTLVLEDEIERKLAVVAEAVHGPVTLRAHPFVAAYYNKGLLSRRRKVSRQLGCKLSVQADTSCNMLDYKFYDSAGNRISL